MDDRSGQALGSVSEGIFILRTSFGGRGEEGQSVLGPRPLGAAEARGLWAPFPRVATADAAPFLGLSPRRKWDLEGFPWGSQFCWNSLWDPGQGPVPLRASLSPSAFPEGLLHAGLSWVQGRVDGVEKAPACKGRPAEQADSKGTSSHNKQGRQGHSQSRGAQGVSDRRG